MVLINREGPYLCPVSTIVVFMSDEYIDVRSDAFALYNSIETYEQLVALTELDKSIPKVYPLHDNGDFKYCIFRQC